MTIQMTMSEDPTAFSSNPSSWSGSSQLSSALTSAKATETSTDVTGTSCRETRRRAGGPSPRWARENAIREVP